jgi:hypothetical protein
MRPDEQGFFCFVDRLDATFRWGGENVSAAEVTGVVASCPGVGDAGCARYSAACAGVGIVGSGLSGAVIVHELADRDRPCHSVLGRGVSCPTIGSDACWIDTEYGDMSARYRITLASRR